MKKEDIVWYEHSREAGTGALTCVVKKADNHQKYRRYRDMVYEKGPYEENIYEEHIFFVRPLLEHDGVREAALRRKYTNIYFS